jgi:CRP/FNR family transcriptional regulator, cyclic AMP receptor protein
VSLPNPQPHLIRVAFWRTCTPEKPFASIGATKPCFHKAPSPMLCSGSRVVIAILSEGNFFGEGCLAGQAYRMETATAVRPARVIRIAKEAMLTLLHQEAEFAAGFTAYLLSRHIRMEQDLLDQLFNSSEKRLARLLLLMAHYGHQSEPLPVIAKISHQTLAEMIGTTRSRVTFFMNRFRKRGFIDYNQRMHVHHSLLKVLLDE